MKGSHIVIIVFLCLTTCVTYEAGYIGNDNTLPKMESGSGRPPYSEPQQNYDYKEKTIPTQEEQDRIFRRNE